VLRAADEAFELAELPRTRAAFEARLAHGRTRLSDVVMALGKLALDVQVELGKAQALLRPLAGKPGIARAVVDDVTSQLAHLVPADLWAVVPLPRIQHVLRYLRALVVRLQRQAVDPQKDAAKAAPILPLWQTYVARRAELAAKGRSARELDELASLFEELRVQVFAPELKTAGPVSLARVQDAWSKLQ